LGESGCGKSVTALSIMGLIAPPGRIAAGRATFDGRDLIGLSETELNRVRGDDLAMIFQEPLTSLNPVLRIGTQISENIRLHQGASAQAAHRRTIELLGDVGLPAPETQVGRYPHQLSGGMRQRVMIAMALSCRPKLLIADEPTTALDVTIQAQILDLLVEAQGRTGMAVLLITHDLGVMAEAAGRVVVMYAGQVVEEAGVLELFDRPRHPYTQGLLVSRPTVTEKRDRLPVVGGLVPHPSEFPPGCRFHPRCPRVMDVCRTRPPSVTGPPGHRVRCRLYEGEWS
jgi:peptide/nickel transport system ATP-binding protein